MYDRVLVDPAPLPPHERTWRHPSELGPTRLDVDTGSRTPVGVLVAGACAVLVVVALVVVATPRPSSTQLAISATTSPAARAITRSEPVSVAEARHPTGFLSASFAAFPHAISAVARPDDRMVIAESIPDQASMVDVRTDDVTYRMRWSQVPFLDAPDGTVIYDLDGNLVARVMGGELVSLVDD